MAIEPDTATLLYGVIGDPVAHSLGPCMHNAALARLGLNGVYLAFAVRDLPAAINGMRALGIMGLSVTLPHKITVMDLLDEIDPLAARIGAVNTIVHQNGRLVGYNTDSTGAVAALLEKTGIAGKRVAVIGAGGAARAIGFGIRDQKGSVTIVNRTPKAGERLARDLDVTFSPLLDFNGADVDILINATRVGMAPDIDGMPVLPAHLRAPMTVMDIVYNPLKTRLLQHAEAAGCITVDGLAMFVNQGALQFELWTKQPAPRDIMRRVVQAALTGGTVCD